MNHLGQAISSGMSHCDVAESLSTNMFSHACNERASRTAAPENYTPSVGLKGMPGASCSLREGGGKNYRRTRTQDGCVMQNDSLAEIAR